MKKFLSLLLTLLMVLTCFSGLTAMAATGSLSASASNTGVTVGNSVTITLKYSGGGANIASFDAQLSYNASAFEYVSAGNEVSAHGGAGIVNISYYATGAQAPSSVTATLTFKAIAAGAGNFSVTTSEFMNDADGTSLGTPSKTLSVSATNPTLSANANLASIKPSAGTLSPKFSASVTSYTITVPYTTTSLSLSATTQDKGAKIAVSGNNSLAVGKNTRVITVTAPSGATKKYTVVITRSANQATTTTTTPLENLPKADVDGVQMAISNPPADATLPEGFALTAITINDISVTVAVNEKNRITLTFLIDPQDEDGAFFVYDETTKKFESYNPLAVSGGTYVLRDMPADLVPPSGALKSTHLFDSVEHAVYAFEDAALKDVVLVYATSPEGKSGLYVYDTTDGSIQLYREITVPVEVEPEPEPVNPFVAFVTQYRQIILICAAALGGVALLIGAVVLLLITLHKDKNCKH